LLLASVLALFDKLTSDTASWRASTSEWTLLSEVSTVTGQRLPPEAASSGRVALGFVGLARFRLEATVRVLSGAPGPQ
jgi:hypothetical protein